MNKILLIFTFLISSLNASEVVLGITSVPLNLNPFYATDANSQNINRLTQLSLIDFDQKMRKTCIACVRYTEAFKKEKHIVFFELKQNLRFWDNVSVKSIDVQNSWKYFIDPKNNSSHITAFSNIETIETLGDFKLKIIFKKFSIENISNLALLKIIKKRGDEYLGSGDYQVTSSSPLEVRLSAVRKIEDPELVFKVVKDETTLALKIINGEIDIMLGGMSPRKYNWLKKNTKNLNFLEMAGTNYKYISFNNENPHFKKKLVREALAHLIPRREILKYKLNGTSVLSEGLFSPSFEAYYNKSQIYKYDEKKAASNLLSAGYKIKNGIWQNEIGELNFDWKVSNNKALIETVNILKDIFKKNGIHINLSVQEWGTFMKNVKKGRFDLIMGQWVGFTGPDMMRFIWHSESFPPKGANRGHYSSREFDSLIDEATNEMDEIKRNQIYRKAQNIAEREYAYLGLWHPNINWITRSCIKNLKLYPNGGFLGLRNLKMECK